MGSRSVGNNHPKSEIESPKPHLLRKSLRSLSFMYQEFPRICPQVVPRRSLDFLKPLIIKGKMVPRAGLEPARAEAH